MLGLGLSIPQLATRGGRTLTLSQQVAALFASGAQGAWYDPSDYTTLFEDSAGTIPITSPLEKPVGLMLDKSKGLVLGSERKADFVTDIVGTATAATYNTTTGEGSVNRVDVSNQSFVTLGSLSSGFYKTTISCQTGSIIIRAGSVTGSQQAAISAGQAVDLYVNTINRISISHTTSAGSSTFTIVSVRELPGNHAYQSTTTSRPTLSARYNLLTKTEQFNDGVWAKTGSTTAASTTIVAAPYGSGPVNKLVSANGDTSGQLYRNVTQTDSCTAVICAKKAEWNYLRFNPDFDIDGSKAAVFNLNTGVVSAVGASASASIAPVGGGWYLCTVTVARTGVEFNLMSQRTPSLQFNGGGAGDGTSGIYIWGADLRVANDGVNLPSYQRVNTATDFAVDGFPAADVFDGVDDHEITAAGGGSTTAFFWCSSIRVGKVGAVQTLFSDTGTNTGYRVRINASNQLELAAGNGSAYTTATTSDTLALGQRAVLTAWHDGANLNVQINNGTVVQTAFATATAGTAQITIGKDNNAASSYFMGRLYEKVYLKDTVVSASNITATKNYCANKAKITL